MENVVARTVVLCGLLALPTQARAQRVLFEMHGEHVQAGFGRYLNSAGDVDGDGMADLLIFRRDYSGDVQPLVDLVSGATKEILHSWPLDFLPSNEANIDLDSLADVDGDGTRDIVIAQAAPTGVFVRVHSGSTAALLYEIGFPGANSGAVKAVRSGDLDGDGHEDLLLAVPHLDQIQARSGVDGALVYAIDTQASYSLDSIGDVTGDGLDDWISALSCDALAEVHSGADGGLVYTYTEGDPYCSGGRFGETVAGLGDVDEDGVPDFAVSQPYWNAGRVWLYSGADGSLIRRLLPVRYEYSPRSMAAMDVDGDGIPELLGVEGRYYAYNCVAIWEVNKRWETYVNFPPPLDTYPELVARDQPGDFDGDGFEDLLVSAAEGPGGSSNGSVFILSLQGDCNQNGQPDVIERHLGGMADCNGNSIPDECDIASGFSVDLDLDGVPDECSCPAATTFCSEVLPNSTGFRASMSASGIPSVGQDSYHVTVQGGPPLEPGLLLGGTSVVSLPFGNGILCVSPALRLVPFAFDGSGRSLLGVDLDTGPLAVIRPGETWYLQAWFRDTAAGGAGYNFSRGVGQLFCN